MLTCFVGLSIYLSVYKQITTGDESWIYTYDPETTDRSSEYRLKGKAKPKRPRKVSTSIQTTFQHASKTGGNVGTCACVGGIIFRGTNEDFSFYNKIHFTF